MTYYPNTDLIKTYGEWKFNYDRNGSLTSRGKAAAENPSVEEPFASWIFDASDGEVWYYEYDLSGRMTKSSSSKKGISGLTERATYAYDYRGLLVKKTYAEFTADEDVSITGGSTVKVAEWYEYTQDGRLLYTEKSSGSVTTKTDYIWAEATLWCEVDDGEVYYHHTDHLGTTEAVTDSKGKVVWHAEYEAFGSVLSENGSMAFTPSFTGKMLDECSGLYYFNARWYDSECGRFTTSDPVRDGVNFHNYCNGNPLTRIDWTGLDTLDDFEYQLKTNEGLLKQVVTDTAAKGEYCIPFADFTDSKGNSLTGRLAKGLTSSDGQAALQDKTRAYVNSLSQEELEGSINKATVVTGIDPNDVKDAINQLNRYGFDIQFDPTGGDAFSIGGYLFVFNKLNKIGSATTENGVTKYRFNKENEEDQKGVCHENVHLQSALAFGNLFHWFANYNNEFMKNKENGMSDADAYYSLPDEREAYSFGPNGNTVAKRNKNVKY